MKKNNLTDAVQAATAGMFGNAPESVQESRKEDQTDKSSGDAKAAENGLKRLKTVFSFRTWKDEIDDWRTYAKAKGLKVDELGAAAMREYVKRHPIKDEERKYQDAALLLKSRNQKT